MYRRIIGEHFRKLEHLEEKKCQASPHTNARYIAIHHYLDFEGLNFRG